jgi:hypothetical protein
VLLGLDEVSVDRLFAQCLARFEAMQTVYEDEAITIAPNQDGRLLSNFKQPCAISWTVSGLSVARRLIGT